MESALDATNRGFRLLRKMGWKQGTGLGRHEQGIVEPVKMKENLTCLGLGKAEEYDEMTEQATKERRKLDAEVVETHEETALRLERAARDDQLKAEVKATHAAFLCRDCQKQYKTVKEMEHHLSSYDHHHRKRLQDLKKQQTLAPHAQDSKRKREQQHEAEMLQKRVALAAAAAAAAAAEAAAAAANSAAKMTTTTPFGVALSSSSSSAVAPGAKVGFSFTGKTGAAMGANKKKTKQPLSAVASAFTRPLE